jgi:hypothetical protein
VRAQRRRRRQHIQRLRRDLLEDFGLGFVLALLALTMTAGLGVIAILELPLLAVVAGSFVVERRRRRRRAACRPPRSGSTRM